MALVYNQCYDAGYRGHMFSFLTSDVGLLAPVFEPQVLEGYICALSAMETDPAYDPAGHGYEECLCGQEWQMGLMPTT